MSILLYPPYLQWEVIPECNHKCIHCYNYWRTDNLDVEKHADFSAITEKIIERRPVYMAVTGGEPLLVFNEIKPCIEKIIASDGQGINLIKRYADHRRNSRIL